MNYKPTNGGSNTDQSTLSLYDAHNHLQDERLHVDEEMWSTLSRENVRRMVVNGACEGDWGAVLDLAQPHPQVIPSFGYHPWFVKERSPRWREVLIECLNNGIGQSEK